jgi:hypothetical protein
MPNSFGRALMLDQELLKDLRIAVRSCIVCPFLLGLVVSAGVARVTAAEGVMNATTWTQREFGSTS